MKMRMILAASLIVAATAPYGALANPLSNLGGEGYSPRFIQKVSCDIHEDDKQARCMQACDDVWIKATQAYSGNIENAKVEKKACDAKCGC